MSLFEQASLIVTPNAFKAGKLYSIKPTDGSGDLDVVRATTATRVNSAGLIESVANNIPRLDYTNGSCPSILVEPQRTNLLTYSEQFDNAIWGKQSGASVTANTAIAPDGTTTADTINLVSGSTISRVERGGIAFSANTYLTISVYLKNISLTSGQTFQLRFETSGFDLTGTVDLFNKTNTVSITGTTTTGYVLGTQSASITELRDGWLRCSITVQSGTIAIGTGAFYLINNVDANRSFYAWGAQLEAGSNATSYIPTVASAVTRNADVISKTGISDLIGQSEGVLFLEADIQKRNASDFYIAISNGDSLGETIYLSQPSGGNLNILFRTSGLTPTITVLSANWNVGYNKIAIAYNASLGEVFINGVSKGTVALSAIPTCDKFTLASRPDNPGNLVGSGGYKVSAIFKTRLSNEECINLTTL
jgi:hypothetical protein